MKVVCIINIWLENELIIGKTYDVFDENYDTYFLLNNNVECVYFKYRFKLLSEIRNDKIDKLLAE